MFLIQNKCAADLCNKSLCHGIRDFKSLSSNNCTQTCFARRANEDLQFHYLSQTLFCSDVLLERFFLSDWLQNFCVLYGLAILKSVML